MRFSRRPAKGTGLLRMTEWVDEILTSNQTLLRMTMRSAICYIYIKNYSKIGGKEWIFRKSFLTCSF